MVATQSYGTWASPITSELITRAAAAVGEPRVDGDEIWWQELRPEAAGQIQVVCRRADGTTRDVLPEGFSARTRVHEYGGGAWTVDSGRLFFANWSDQRLYRLDPGATPVALTPEPVVAMGERFADLSVVGAHVLGVRELHPVDGSEATNEIVAVPVDGGEPVVLVSGPDFVAGARVSPDQTQFSYFSWNHPNMPWDGTELYVAAIDLTAEQPEVGTPRPVAGGLDTAITQAFWSPAGHLHYCSDEDGWWNLHIVEGDGARKLTDLPAEVGTPHWVFGQSRYAFLASGQVVFAAQSDGLDSLYVLDPDGSSRRLDLPFTGITSLAADGDAVVAMAASFITEPAIARIVVGTDSRDVQTLSSPRDLGLDASWFSIAQPISFESGAEARPSHALFYPPTNPDHTPPAGELPPLVVKIHGGPTSAARPQLSLGVQYWTSRGFAVVDVNYGGSTGYGRAYRELLDRQWGIVDVEDCIAAARFLADTGRADPDRLCITGGSAGGFTVLAALCFSDVFGAGASHYGVADLEALATDTHKFESRYLDRLIGPYPEARDVYLERSPIHHVDSLSSPLIVFQGLEDEIVPPNQAEMIVEAVRAKGVPVAYVPFEGEQHGFRKAENIRTALDGELAFYGRVFGFAPAGDLPDLPIDNL
jgi:dipeptidyl aminopeptidase/acylaminoacyl peptidase